MVYVEPFAFSDTWFPCSGLPVCKLLSSFENIARHILASPFNGRSKARVLHTVTSAPFFATHKPLNSSILRLVSRAKYILGFSLRFRGVSDQRGRG
jgi:hypothetical protein